MRFSLQSSSNSSRSPRARASKVGHATCTPKTNKDSAHDSVENVLKARRKMSTKVNDMENIQGSLTHTLARSNFAQHSFGFFFVWKTNFPGKCTTKGRGSKVNELSCGKKVLDGKKLGQRRNRVTWLLY